MKRASIDLGTNTCLLLIAEVDPKIQQVKEVLEDQSRIVKLGQGVDSSRELHPDAIARTHEALREYHDLVARYGILPEDVVAVGTATARDAKNGAKFFESVTQNWGFRFRTLTGDEEARFTFEGGLLPGMDPARSAVIDIGGGSTELRSAEGGMSLDLGSVRFTERFLHSNPVTDEEFWACQEAADAFFMSARSWRDALEPAQQARGPDLVGVAGTVVNLACMQLALPAFDRVRIDGLILSRGDVHRLVEELKWRNFEERKAMTGLEPGRADVILAGALILWRAMEVLDFPSLRVSTRGLRYGVLSL